MLILALFIPDPARNVNDLFYSLFFAPQRLQRRFLTRWRNGPPCGVPSWLA